YSLLSLGYSTRGPLPKYASKSSSYSPSIPSYSLLFRLIELPSGSALPSPSPPIHHRSHKRHAPLNPSPCLQGYDAPPSIYSSFSNIKLSTIL
ncbi:unnamed protein product, partial [Rotaria sp. Silwood2]